MKHSRPRQHVRRIKSGRSVIVNRGIAKHPKRFDIRNVENKSELMKYAKNKGLKFRYKPVKEMYGFAGLHHGDGIAWDVDIKPDEIWIDKSLDGKYKFEVMRHEVEENEHWKQGDPIWKAHKKSVKHEKYNSRNWRR